MNDTLKIRNKNGTTIFPDQGMDTFIAVVDRLMTNRGPVVLVPVRTKSRDKTGLVFEVLEVEEHDEQKAREIRQKEDDQRVVDESRSRKEGRAVL